MRHLSLSLCAALIFSLVLPASATQAAGLRHQVAEDAQPAFYAASALDEGRRRHQAENRR
jgi:hypothetical protein